MDWEGVEWLVGQQGTGRAGKERLSPVSHRFHLGRISSIERLVLSILPGAMQLSHQPG